MDIEKEAKKILDYWDQYLFQSGFDRKSKIDAHNKIKELIDEPFTDKDLVIEICKQDDFFFVTNVRILDFCSDEIKNDRETLLEILRAYGDNLALLSPELQDDKEIVMAAISSTDALKYASERLRDDDDIVYLSLKTDLETIEFTSNRFKNDKQLILELVKKDHYMLNKVSDELKNDAHFLSEYWYYTRDYFQKINVSPDALIIRIMDNMGENVKPFFNNFNMDKITKRENIIKEFETCLTTAALNKELSDDLNKELDSKGKKKKKPKM